MTRSSKPAPTESIASRVAPLASPWGVSGCTRSNFAPSNCGRLIVATTVPTTRARIMSVLTGVNLRLVDDADDARVRRHFNRVPREAGFLAANEEHGLADTGADRVDRHQRPAHVRAVRRDRLDEQQLDAVEAGIFDGGDDVANHARELHELLADVDAVDDADDRGVDRRVLHAGGHPRRATAHDQYGFADACVHGIEGD